MKKTFMALALAGSLAFGMSAVPLLAQDAAPPPPPMQQGMGGGPHHGWHHRRMTPKRQLRHLTRVLNLTDEQQAQIKPILVERAHRMRAIWKDQSLTRAQLREKMMTTVRESQRKIAAELNPAQKQKYEAMLERRMRRMQQWRKGQGGM